MIINTVTDANNFDVSWVATDSIKPSPENFEIYNPIDRSKREFKALVKSIRDNGIQDSLIVTGDKFILSGHRRLAAAKAAGKPEVPIRFKHDIRRDETSKTDYVKLLASYNEPARNKTCLERFRERLAVSEPVNHQQIVAAKLESRLETKPNTIESCGFIKRSTIGPRKQEFLDAVKSIVLDSKEHWPISQRWIHYRLLVNPPLTNSSKGKQRNRYANDGSSSTKLSDLVTRAQIEGKIPFHAIADETRPEKLWNVNDGVEEYLESVVRHVTSRYYRDLTVDQPDHIEIVLEKLTVKRQVESVAMKYTIPVTVARGKSSLPPRQHVVQRWRNSGKERLVLLILADHDPSGHVIADMWHKSLIGDFGLDPEDLVCIRAGLTAKQAIRFKLPTSLDAKKSDPAFKKFAAKYGKHAFELDALKIDALKIDALKIDELKLVLREAIESVIDRDAYDEQVKIEEEEARLLIAVKSEMDEFIADLIGEMEL